MRFFYYPQLRTNLERFVRRRQALKNGKDGQESPADPETTQEDFFIDERESEVVELQPEPEPSARDEFHQAYTDKLQAADKDLEDYSKTLDSLSYPVSVMVPLSPQQNPHTSSCFVGFVILCHHPPSHRLRIRTLLGKYVLALR